MTKPRDENDRLRDGDLGDGFSDTEPIADPSVPEWQRTLEGLWAPLEFGQLTTPPQPREWLLRRDHAGGPGFLPLGKAGMLAAGGGVGKTMALCQLALAVAREEPVSWWLNHFPVPTTSRGKVLLALGEEDTEEVHRRLYNASQVLEMPEADMRAAAARIVALPLAGVPVGLVESGTNGNAQETDFLHWLRAKLTSDAGDSWKLIVLDPLSRWAGSDTEKDNAAATRFVQAIETLLKVPGNPTVLVAHHTSQAARQSGSTDATAARGATALTDGFRWQANLVTEESDPDVVSLKLAKQNYGPQMPGKVYMRRSSEHGGALVGLSGEFLAKAEVAKLKPKGNGKPTTKAQPTATEDDYNDLDV